MKNILKLLLLLCVLLGLETTRPREETITRKNSRNRKKMNVKNIKKRRKREKRKKHRITVIDLQNKQQLEKLVEENIEKSTDLIDPNIALAEGNSILDQESFDESAGENTIKVGNYYIDTSSIDPDKAAFIQDNIETLALLSIYDALRVQARLDAELILSASPNKNVGEEAESIINANIDIAKDALKNSDDFQILSDKAYIPIIKKSIMALIKNIQSGNIGEEESTFRKIYNKIRRAQSNPMQGVINFIKTNKLMKELDKWKEDEDTFIKYVIALTAIQLNKKSNFFDNILQSDLLKKLITAASLKKITPVDKESKINQYEKNTCKQLLHKLFKLVNVKLPKFEIVQDGEYAVGSTLAARLLSIAAGTGLAITAAGLAYSGRAGYKAYKNDDPTKTFWEKFKQEGRNEKAELKKETIDAISTSENEEVELEKEAELKNDITLLKNEEAELEEEAIKDITSLENKENDIIFKNIGIVGGLVGTGILLRKNPNFRRKYTKSANEYIKKEFKELKEKAKEGFNNFKIKFDRFTKKTPSKKIELLRPYQYPSNFKYNIINQVYKPNISIKK